MEISRQFKSVLVIPSASAEAAAENKMPPRNEQAGARRSAALPLEQMQQALRALPDVDADKVAQVKLALQRGQLATEPAELASSMLAYHRGSDV